MKIDMHLHTRGSFDCLSDPAQVVERAIERGLDMICITDHNEIGAAVALQERFPDRIIVGINGDAHAKQVMEELYQPLTRVGKPLLVMSRESAEIISPFNFSAS